MQARHKVNVFSVLTGSLSRVVIATWNSNNVCKTNGSSTIDLALGNLCWLVCVCGVCVCVCVCVVCVCVFPLVSIFHYSRGRIIVLFLSSTLFKCANQEGRSGL